MGDAPPQEGGGVGRIRKTQHWMVLKGLFLSLMKGSLLVFLAFFNFTEPSEPQKYPLMRPGTHPRANLESFSVL